MNKLIDVSDADYYADNMQNVAVPTLSQSVACNLINRSPVHAWIEHPRLGGKLKEPTKEMDKGSILHTLLLGRGKKIVAVSADNWRTNAAKDLRDSIRSAGNIPVLEREFDEYDMAATAIRLQMEKLEIEFSGVSEQAMIWQEETEDGNTVTCKGKMDHWILADSLIYDLKKVQSAHPRAIQSSCLTYGYDIQHAAYTAGISHIYPEIEGRIRMIFLFVEIEPPYAVVPAEMDGTMKELGRRKWQRAVNIWERCLRLNEWPGYTESKITISAPVWALTEEAAFGDLEMEI